MSAQQYRLIVDGELGARYASAFEGMAISAHDGMTEITGSVVDQSHLQGLIGRIADLGLRLRSITPLDTTPQNAPLPRAGPAGAHSNRAAANAGHSSSPSPMPTRTNATTKPSSTRSAPAGSSLKLDCDHGGSRRSERQSAGHAPDAITRAITEHPITRVIMVPRSATRSYRQACCGSNVRPSSRDGGLGDPSVEEPR
jgi:hypothetical protein